METNPELVPRNENEAMENYHLNFNSFLYFSPRLKVLMNTKISVTSGQRERKKWKSHRLNSQPSRTDNRFLSQLIHPTPRESATSLVPATSQNYFQDHSVKKTCLPSLSINDRITLLVSHPLICIILNFFPHIIEMMERPLAGGTELLTSTFSFLRKGCSLLIYQSWPQLGSCEKTRVSAIGTPHFLFLLLTIWKITILEMGIFRQGHSEGPNGTFVAIQCRT